MHDHGPGPAPGIYLCQTCRHLSWLYSRTHIGGALGWEHNRTPQCALGLPWGGHAMDCDRYEREPGSDDEIHYIPQGDTPYPAYGPSRPQRCRPPGRWRIVGTANVADEPIGGWDRWERGWRTTLMAKTRVR